MVKTNKDDLYSFEHCVQRYKERYNKVLTFDSYNELNEKVKKWFNKNNNEFKIVSKDKINKNNYSYILECYISNELTFIVFEDSKNCITTFLPVDSVLNKIKKQKKY